MPWYYAIKSCFYLQIHCNLLINHSKFVQKLKKYLIIESDLQQSTEESLMNHWMSPEHFMAFYGITLYKNKIFLSLDLLKLIHYFHKFPPLPSWDINHKLYPLLSYRYTFLCHYFPHNYTALEYHREGQSDLHWTEAWHLQFFSGSQLDHSHFHIFMITKQSECFSDHLKKTSSNAHRWCLMFEVNYLAPHLNFFSFHGIVR